MRTPRHGHRHRSALQSQNRLRRSLSRSCSHRERAGVSSPPQPPGPWPSEGRPPTAGLSDGAGRPPLSVVPGHAETLSLALDLVNRKAVAGRLGGWAAGQGAPPGPSSGRTSALLKRGSYQQRSGARFSHRFPACCLCSQTRRRARRDQPGPGPGDWLGTGPYQTRWQLRGPACFPRGRDLTGWWQPGGLDYRCLSFSL